ncbi:MAG TPA: hypothetical protein VHW66_18980 [Stellaceae bacterium]|jgi:hypothetical protein|nr:hypothetical protein [Stellaceae bacterium]
MEDPIIHLGDKEFVVEALTLRQMKRLMVQLTMLSGINPSGPEFLDAAVQIIAAAIDKKHPEMTADGILDMNATLEQVNQAVSIVLRTAGLAQDGAQGEAAPVGA